METCFEYLTDDKYGTFCSDEKKWVRQIKELHAQYPDQVKIISDQNGSIMAHLPKSWFKVKPPVKRNLTEEQRKEASDRMRLLRQQQESSFGE